MRRIGLATIIMVCVTFAASAQPVTDPETGVTLTPPPTYTAQISKIGFFGRGHKQVSFMVAPRESLLTRCEVTLVLSSSSENRTQAERDQSVIKMLRMGHLDAEYGTLNETFEYLGARGIIQIAPKSGIERRSAFNRFRIMVYPPQGIINLTCTIGGLDFEARRPELEAIVRGISFSK